MEYLYFMSKEELIEYILELNNIIDVLEYELKKEKDKNTKKINQEYEQNRELIANIFMGVLK